MITKSCRQLYNIFNLCEFDEARFFAEFQHEHKQIIDNFEDEVMNNSD